MTQSRDGAKPDYVHRWPLLNTPKAEPGYQPFVAQGVRMYGFVFQGMQQNLADLCVRYLSQPSGGQLSCTPIAPYWVLLTFTDTRSLASQNVPYASLGWAPEREAAFWVPVEREGGAIRSFAPYMFVDNPIAIIQGREIYGFPKEVGWFEGLPQSDQTPTRLTLDVYGTREFKPTLCAGQYRLLEINRSAGSLALPAATWEGLPAALGDLTRAALHTKPDMLFPPSLGMVFLKQIPDVQDGRSAAYQAIIEARATLTALPRGGLLPGNYELLLRQLDSHPIAADLGLRSGQRALFSYWLDLDFIFESGSVVWP